MASPLYHTAVDADTVAIQAVIDAHDSNILTDSQKDTLATQVTKTQVKEYLRTQLFNPSPNPTAIRATIETAIGGNTNLTQFIENMGIVKQYNVTTNLGYIAACIDSVAILL